MVSYFFRFSSEKQRKLAKNLRRGFRNHNLHVQGNNLRNFSFKKSLFSNRFCNFSNVFSTLGKAKSAGIVKTTFGVSRGKMWGFLIEKRMIFHIFLHFDKNHCWFLPNSYGRVSETSIYVSGEKFWEKKNEKRWFLRNFVIWVKKLGNWANKIMQGLPKVHSACPGELLEEKNLVEEEWFLSTSHALREKLSSFEQKKSWTFGKKFAVCFSELHSSCPEDVFEEKHIWKWWFSCAFCALSESFWSIGGKLFFLFNKQFTIGFSKPKFTCPGKQIENFFGKSFGFSSFSVLWPKYFWFLGKNFFQGVLKLHRPVQMEALRIFFENNLEFLWFLHLERKTFGPLQNI